MPIILEEEYFMRGRGIHYASPTSPLSPPSPTPVPRKVVGFRKFSEKVQNQCFLKLEGVNIKSKIRGHLIFFGKGVGGVEAS